MRRLCLTLKLTYNQPLNFIMKAHVFISVLAFHVVVIAGLYLLSACSSSSGPSPDQAQSSPRGGSIYDQYAEPNRPSEDENLIVTQVTQPQSSRGVDPAFNSGSNSFRHTPSSGSSGVRVEPRRPRNDGFVTPSQPVLNEFREDEVLEPLTVAQPSSPAVQYQVKKGDSLWKISRSFDISLKELLAANGLNENSTIQVGQTIVIPSEASGPPLVSSSSPGASLTEVYTVVKGDTLSRIAKAYNSTVNDIQVANGLKSDIIQLGQRLTVPVNSLSSGGSSPAPASTPRVAPSVSRAPAPATAAASDDGSIRHEVQSGETPGGIAKLYGITTAQLMNDNGIKDARSLRVGQALTIRLGTAALPSGPPAPVQPPATQPSQPLTTPSAFDESLFDDLEDIPEVEVVPRS